MTNEEIVAKLTEAIKISDNTSIYNDEHDRENPGPMTALSMIDDLIVDVLTSISPDWKRP